MNKHLPDLAIYEIRDAGGDVTCIDLADYPMPIYDFDLEMNGDTSDNAFRLFDLMMKHQGLLLACPEYNGSITPLLKNTIDWVSRRQYDDPPLAAFDGKVAGLLSASPGALGGMRGLVHVRDILQNMGVIVLPNQVAVPNAREALNESLLLTDEDHLIPRIADLASELVERTQQLNTKPSVSEPVTS